jgi:hypothetical protein
LQWVGGEHVRNAAANQTDDVSVPKFRTLRPTCRWQRASDGALVMVWSIAATKVPALRVVGGTDADDKTNELRQRAIKRGKSLAERAAIALLLGVSGYLTLLFTSDYVNFP